MKVEDCISKISFLCFSILNPIPSFNSHSPLFHFFPDVRSSFLLIIDFPSFFPIFCFFSFCHHSQVMDVWVGGEEVVRDGKLRNFEVDQKEIEEMNRRLLKFKSEVQMAVSISCNNSTTNCFVVDVIVAGNPVVVGDIIVGIIDVFMGGVVGVSRRGWRRQEDAFCTPLPQQQPSQRHRRLPQPKKRSRGRAAQPPIEGTICCRCCCCCCVFFPPPIRHNVPCGRLLAPAQGC